MSVALVLCPDAAPERLVEDARRLRWIAQLLRGLGVEPLVVIAAARRIDPAALALAGGSLTAEALAWSLVSAPRREDLPRRLAIRLQAEGLRLALYYDCPELEEAQPAPLLPGAAACAGFAVVRRRGAGGARWVQRCEPLSVALPEPLPGLRPLRARVRAAAAAGLAAPDAAPRRLLLAGEGLSAAALRPLLTGIRRGLDHGFAPAVVEIHGLPAVEEEAEALALVGECARRWPLPLILKPGGDGEALARAAAEPGTLTLLPEGVDPGVGPLRLLAALGLPVLLPVAPDVQAGLRAQLPAGAAVAFCPAGDPEDLARALAAPPRPAVPPEDAGDEAGEAAWRGLLAELVAGLPARPTPLRFADPAGEVPGAEAAAVGVVVAARAAADPLALCLESWRGQSRAPAGILVMDLGAGLGEAPPVGADGLHRPEPGESLPAAAARLAREAGWSALLLCGGDSLAAPDLLARQAALLADGGLVVCFARGLAATPEAAAAWLAAARGGEAVPEELEGTLQLAQPAFANGLWRSAALAAVAPLVEGEPRLRLADLEDLLSELGLPHRRLPGVGFAFRRRWAVTEAPRLARPAPAADPAERLERVAARLGAVPAALLAGLEEAASSAAPGAPARLAETAERLLARGAPDAAARFFCAALFAGPGEEQGGERERLPARLQAALAQASRPAEADRLRAALTAAGGGA